MGFDFEETAGTSQNGLRKQLEGNKIHDVEFKGCESRTTSTDKNILEIKFENEEGVFTKTVWEPKDDDYKDRPSKIEGYVDSPSNVKCMMLMFKHLIDTVNPTLASEIDSKKRSISAKSWEELCKLMVEMTNPGKGTKLQIKLIKNNKGEGDFPYFASYNKEHVIYMRTNFIGKKLFFTNKELTSIKKFESAKPTSITDDLSLSTSSDEEVEKQDVGDLSFNL